MLRRSYFSFIMLIHIVVSSVDVSTSVSVLDENDDEIVSVTLLSESWNPQHRVRKSAGAGVPDKLSFAIPFRGDNIVLNLERSRLLPTVTSDEVTTRAANEFSERAAVYTDFSMESAIIVTKETDQYALNGSFVHSGREWVIDQTMEHNASSDRSGRLRHRIHGKTQTMTTSYVGDTVLLHEDVLDSEREEDDNTKFWKTAEKISRKTSQTTKRKIANHVIEIAFVVDFADYRKWVNYLGQQKAVQAMRLWYTYVAESINIRYQTITDPEISIRTTVTGLKILTKARDAYFISVLADDNEEVNGSKALLAFYKWYQRQSDIPASDHYMLFTGLDMDSIGISYVGKVCRSLAVSVSVNNFNGFLGEVAAHELGHSLSADHDSETAGLDACRDEDQFVMTTISQTPVRSANEGNRWRFSPCSVKSFKKYLSRVHCTLQTSKENALPEPSSGHRAGENITRDSQCRLHFRDPSSYFCEDLQLLKGGLNELCGGMYCNLPHDSGYCSPIIPQEFTPCGTIKWCVAGRCLDKPMHSMPSTTIPPTTTPSTTASSTTTPSTTTPSTTTPPTTTPSTTTPSDSRPSSTSKTATAVSTIKTYTRTHARTRDTTSKKQPRTITRQGYSTKDQQKTDAGNAGVHKLGFYHELAHVFSDKSLVYIISIIVLVLNKITKAVL